MIDVAVLGAGAVGGFVAAALERAGTTTTIVAREASIHGLVRDGLRVQSVRFGSFIADGVAMVTELHDPVDVLVVAVKAPALDAALDRVTAEPGLVVPLLNGVEHLDALKERFGPSAVAGSIRIGAERRDGRIHHTSPSVRIDLAPPYPAVEAFADALRVAEIPVKVLDREPDVLWSKLVRLNALASTTSAADATIGVVRTHPQWRVLLEGVVDETAIVAQAEGATIDAGTTLEELMALGPDHDSSLHRDLAAGAVSELDAICGAVLRAAERHGIPAPTLEDLVARIRARYPHA